MIDDRALMTFLLGAHKAMRDTLGLTSIDLTKPQNVADILARFLRDMRMRNTIYTDIVWKHKSRPPATAVALETAYVNYDNLADVKVQIGVTDKIIRLDHNSFVAWLARHKLGSQQINAELKKQFGMEIGNSSLGAGTRFVAAPMRTMEFDASSGAMNTYFDTL